MHAVNRRRFLQLSAGGAVASLLASDASRSFAMPGPDAPMRPPAHELLLGANLQGWASRGESSSHALARLWPVLRPQVVRDWPTGKTWTWDQRVAAYPRPTSLIVEFTPTSVLSPTTDDLLEFKRICRTAPVSRTNWLTIGHEVELWSRPTSGRPNAFKAGLDRFIEIHRQYAPPTLRHAVVLMGSTYLSDRWTWGQTVPYRAYDPRGGPDWLSHLDIDDIGADIYQQVTGGGVLDRGTPDSALYALGPVLDIAEALDKGVIVPEFGTYCVDSYFRLNHACTGIRDAARAKFIGDALSYMRQHWRFRGVCTFEATEGGWANPCCLTPPPDWPGGPYSPMALAAWH